MVEAISPEKDVDGLHPANVAALVQGVEGLLPCTPAGCIELLDRHDIALEGKHVVVYKFAADLHFYVTGTVDENEIILASVLNGFFDAVSLLLRGVLEKRAALENLDLVLLTIDELVDGGIVLETDANVIANRVSMRGVDGETPLAEQTLSQALNTAREQLTRNLLR